jgi:hypothetical protein
LPRTIQKPESLGLKIEKLKDGAGLDEGISEFSRFYLERREYEAGRTEDERKRRKLQDEFTPRPEMTLVGLDGKLHREVRVKTKYNFDTDDDYESSLTITPHDRKIIDGPELGLCSQSGRTVPISCLSKCEITGAEVLRHLLVKSDISGRFALPEFTVVCSASGKRLFRDEADISAVTSNLVWSDLLKVSALSGRRAEAEYFDVCPFTQTDLLKDELAVSEISGKRYRVDQQLRSIVSGRTGHTQEFVICHETRQPIVLDEAERCEITGYSVRIGALERCEVSGKKVLPIGLDRCTITGKRALKRFLVNSSLEEKLHDTLEQRLTSSFKVVSDQLEQVFRGLGEMQTLATGVGDLKRMMTNVRARGTWGEVTLANILEHAMGTDQYEKNVEIRPGSNQRVEFAIKLPGGDAGPLWLPIDAKFPTEDYERLVDASDKGDLEAMEASAKAVEIRIRHSADEICTKYVHPPYSTDFAILFLPTEGLYAEIIRRPGVVDSLQRDFRIIITGPTTLLALLNSLRMGFRTLAIQKRSSEVWQILGAVKSEFGKYGATLEKVQKKLQEASNTIDDVSKRRKAIDRKLRSVEVLPEMQAEELLAVTTVDATEELGADEVPQPA